QVLVLLERELQARARGLDFGLLDLVATRQFQARDRRWQGRLDVAVDRLTLVRQQLGLEVLRFLAQSGELRRLLRQRVDALLSADRGGVAVRVPRLLFGKELLQVGKIPEP